MEFRSGGVLECFERRIMLSSRQRWDRPMGYRTVMLDIELQRDFFSPGGTCFSEHSLAAGRNVRRLFRWARGRRIPVLSTMLRLRSDRPGPLAPVPHCVEGTPGEKRISGALLARHVDLGIRNSTDLLPEIFEKYQQVLFEKRHTDVFAHAGAERLLTELQSDTFVICGAGTAHGIVQAALGLRHRKRKVVLATDAILDLDDRDAEMAWLRMLAKGAVPLTTDEILAASRRPRSTHRQWRARPRDPAMTG